MTSNKLLASTALALIFAVGGSVGRAGSAIVIAPAHPDPSTEATVRTESAAPAPMGAPAAWRRPSATVWITTIPPSPMVAPAVMAATAIAVRRRRGRAGGGASATATVSSGTPSGYAYARAHGGGGGTAGMPGPAAPMGPAARAGDATSSASATATVAGLARVYATARGGAGGYSYGGSAAMAARPPWELSPAVRQWNRDRQRIRQAAPAAIAITVSRAPAARWIFRTR